MPITLGRPTRRDSAICTCVSLCWMRITYAARAARTSACACCVASVLANAVVNRETRAFHSRESAGKDVRGGREEFYYRFLISIFDPRISGIFGIF